MQNIRPVFRAMHSQSVNPVAVAACGRRMAHLSRQPPLWSLAVTSLDQSIVLATFGRNDCRDLRTTRVSVCLPFHLVSALSVCARQVACSAA